MTIPSLRSATMLLATPALLAASAHAATLVTNGDFEDWPGANPPNWSLLNQATVTKVSGLGGGNAATLSLSGASPSADSHIRPVLSSTIGPAVPFSFSIDFNQSAVTAGQRGFNLTLRNTGTTVLNFAVIGNQLNATTGSTFSAISSVNLSASNWYRLVVSGNLQSGGTYSVDLYDLTADTANPVISLTNLSAWQTNPSNTTTINEFRLERGRSAYDWTADNISVIPEPTSALLAGVGLLGLATRRKRQN